VKYFMTQAPLQSPSPTLAAIASMAGVSRVTVSNVLEGRTRGLYGPSAQRAKRIREIADRLGYRPNSAARATVCGRFDALGLLMSTRRHRSFLPRELVDGIQTGCAEHNQHLHLAKLPDEQVTDDHYIPRILRELAVDGLLINFTSEIPERMLSLIHDFGVPSVWINSKQDYNSVRPDDLEAGRRATEALLQAGHHRILYTDLWPAWHYSKVDRREGYEQAMRSAGLVPQVLSRCVAYLKRPAAYCEAMAGPDRPTAIVAYGDGAFIIAGAAMAGFRLPDDLAVVVLGGDSALSGLMAQMPVPEAEMGRAGVEMLMNKIGGQVSETPTRIIPFGPIVGDVRSPTNASHRNP